MLEANSALRILGQFILRFLGFKRGLLNAIFNWLFLGLLVTGFYVIYVNNFLSEASNQQYAELARGFLEGRTYYINNPSFDYPYADCSYFNGNYFWPLGVFPALLLLPFVNLFRGGFTQGLLSGILTTANFILLFLLSCRLLKNTEKSLYMAFAYTFASAYYFVGMQPVSWYLAHVVVTAGLLGAVYFAIVKQGYTLAGLLFTVGFLSRISVAFGVLFFVYLIWDRTRKTFIRNIALFLAPVIVGILIFCSYNYMRFGKPLETGYKYQLLFTELVGNRDNGIWTFRHFPTNIYYLFLKGPNASFEEGTKMLTKMYSDVWGLGFFFTSPIFIYLLFADTKNRLVKASVLGAVPVMLFLLGSFGIGAYQYGYRFALDFQPFLYLILLTVFKERQLNNKVKMLIILSAVFNAYMSNNFISDVIALTSSK